ncbi:aldehyde dehydrogenase family protein [Bacillus sp. PS06]|uniref:aldehyde dehydrogenase family protein n=1 Tax=Bacillus sp. PS06 TaxID=2764176 RepID=UPI0017824DC6|nr:aldehyde dehydrogenase family protein [Bacillus sp. PS06]MBD8067966.1 aldehyde dehydrogenase family protein [Bacillus sp. PS06]
MSVILKEKLYINGEWIVAEQYKTLFSPYKHQPLAEVPVATATDVKHAIEAAYQAVDIMRKMPSHERASILERIVALFEERFHEAAEMIAKEAGKPIKAARVEVSRTIQTYKFAAEEAKRITGELIPLDAAPGGENRIAYTKREPIGVVAAITPFNFPMNLVAHKVGPAIAAGNTVVLKPASQTPMSAYFLARICEEAGLPKGVLNIVTGEGRIIGEMLTASKLVKKITFTGSPEVGIKLRKKAGLKKVTLELGSNSAVIIDHNAPLNKIISRCVAGAFSFQGQVCISLQRIYVHEKIYSQFVKEFIEETKTLKIGDPLHEETDISALISSNDSQRVKTWLEEAIEEGASVALGGDMQDEILNPTVLLNVPPTSRISCHEVFAPVVLITKVPSIDVAIKEVNDSQFGLQAGIFTQDINTAFEAADKLEVGGVLINDIPTFRVDQMPYGGVKNSGIGREGIKYAIEEMTEMKLVIINRN